VARLVLTCQASGGKVVDQVQFHGHGHGSEHGTSMKRVFATLFPFESPAWNSSESPKSTATSEWAAASSTLPSVAPNLT
jgi:hypothetical protein